MHINWEDAPEWAHVVVDAYSRLFYLEHNHSGKITYAQRVDGSGGRMTSTDNHVWWSFDVVEVRPDVVPYELTRDCFSGCAWTAERKVRKDFDPKQSISVDVSNCTADEKKKVQQAFFDVGIKWKSGMAGFGYLNARLYTNSTAKGTCHGQLMHGTLPRIDSISHRQFLELVYEPEQQGHVHADLMARNIFISQAYAIYNSNKPKYEVFGAMFDAGCRFPEE